MPNKRKPVTKAKPEKRVRTRKQTATAKPGKSGRPEGVGKRALKYAGIPLRDKALVELFGYKQNQSGVNVDENNAESVSAYFSGVTLISNVVGMLPTAVYKKEKNGGYSVDETHQCTNLFRNTLNANTTSIIGKEMMQRAAITWGNGYAYIERAGGQGMPIALWPLLPQQVTPDYADNGEKVYKFKGTAAGEKDRTYKENEIVHVPGMSYDGLAGRSVVNLAAESLGVALAAERFGGSFFGNNAVPGGIVSHPGELSPEGEQNLKNELNKKMQGPYKSRRLIVLDEGMKYTPIGIPPEDSQFLQTRQFQVREVCRWLRIPPHMLFDMEGATFSNIENMSLQFLIYCIQPWLKRWMQELNRKLLTPDEQQSSRFDFDVSELLQMDTKTRFEVYSSGKNMSVFTLNDILKREGLPTVDPEIGNIRIAPSTMKSLGEADPSTPIDPGVMQNAYATVKLMSGDGKKAVKWKHAKAVLDACMPSANEETIIALLRSLADANYVIALNKTPQDD